MQITFRNTNSLNSCFAQAPAHTAEARGKCEYHLCTVKVFGENVHGNIVTSCSLNPCMSACQEVHRSSPWLSVGANHRSQSWVRVILLLLCTVTDSCLQSKCLTDCFVQSMKTLFSMEKKKVGKNLVFNAESSIALHSYICRDSSKSNFCTETKECLLYTPVCQTNDYEVRERRAI